MDLTQAFAIAVKITIFATLFATGLAASTEDIGYLRHRPALLARALLATVVLAPIFAIVLALALPIGRPAAIAIVAGALAPGLPTVPRTGRKIGGNVAFACSLLVVTSVLGVITIPLWIEIIRRIAGADVALSPLEVLKMLAPGLLLPLLAGVGLRRFAPSIADKIAEPASRFANALLPGLVLVVLLVGGQALAALGWPAIVAMIVVPLVALGVGHVLGGPRPEDRTVLAIANAARFPALAALIAATSFPEAHALPAVIAYVVISNVVALPYEIMRKRRHLGAQPAAGAPAMSPPLPAPAI
jgi:BASS family bile acid:Na+ symporter